LSEQTFKLKGWSPQGRPPEDEAIHAFRQLIIEVVDLYYHHNLARNMPFAITLAEIYDGVRRRITALASTGKWPYGFRSKRWIDRRVNECACPTYWPDGVPPLVAVTAGHYISNPKKLEVQVDA